MNKKERSAEVKKTNHTQHINIAHAGYPGHPRKMLCKAFFISLFAAVALALKAGDFVEIYNPDNENHGKICVVENPLYFHPKDPEVARVTVSFSTTKTSKDTVTLMF